MIHTILIVISIMLMLSQVSLANLADNKDHDYMHITFVNQTNKTIKFVEFDGQRSKTLESHTANYLSMPGCKREPKRTYRIQFKHIKHHKLDKWIKDQKGNKVTRSQSCGSTLYLWHKDGKYHMTDKPHIKADLSSCVKTQGKKPILFAHGYNDNQKAWSKFAKHAIKTGDWRVFRTSVSGDGSMRKRAHMLAKYINKAADECKIKDNSLRVVAHSMGGLDIRYLVSNPSNSNELNKAAEKIERIYTLATPHRGDNLGNFVVEASDAGRDLTPKHMKWFNKHNKYKDFDVPLLALRFSCKGSVFNSNDGVVNVAKQSYRGAKMSEHIYRGRHTTGVCLGTHVPTLELENTKILDKILNDHMKGGKNISHKTAK